MTKAEWDEFEQAVRQACLAGLHEGLIDDDQMDLINAGLENHKLLLEAATEFVKRVDEGTIRSTYTYGKLKGLTT